MATEAQGAKAEMMYPDEIQKCNDTKTILGWWHDTAMVDAESVVEKLNKYGSLDFHAVCMLALVNRPHGSIREGTEIAIASYVAGKLNRILEAYGHGIFPDEDSWDDLARYVFMARYVRRFGRWP